MSDLRDFLNWFDGFAENIDKTPTTKQWTKIKERVAALRTAGLDSSQEHLSAIKTATTTVKLPPAPPPKPDFPYYIDHDDVVKNEQGKPLLRDQVKGKTVFDLRGDGMGGDVVTITWADGSTGINGTDFNIALA